VFDGSVLIQQRTMARSGWWWLTVSMPSRAASPFPASAPQQVQGHMTVENHDAQ
jgi:hypothetical protein